MHKHAYLIMAHGSWGILEKLLRLLDAEYNDFYLHIDVKAKNVPDITAWLSHSKLRFIEPTDVRWADYSQSNVELRLLDAALRHGGYSYFHLLSGVDLPLKPAREIYDFFESSGWTTNQFLEGLMCAITNNVTDENWPDEYKRDAAEVAAWKLGEIDSPAVTNFFRQFNDGDDTPRLKTGTIPPIFWRTNLEPEVLAYMRTLCVRTNVYRNVETIVMGDMFKTLSTMPDELKPAATNRVAQYMYFAIKHTTRRMGWQDRELSNFIPAYSNSLQRLSLMRYVSTSATNDWERSNAAQVVQRLESMPTNQLNDVSWIEQDE